MTGERSFEPRFFENHPLFWPIARAAGAFAGETDWPRPETYARGFRSPGTPPVRFESASLPPRRRRRELDPTALYDARIAQGWVPTRERSWHDYLNALVWATFPRAKRALHAAQLGALASSIEPGARRLPTRRSRAHDALALVDEGGVVVLDDGSARLAVVFGHALYEGLVLARGPMTACALRARVGAIPHYAAERTELADAHLAGVLGGPPLVPEALERLRIAGSDAVDLDGCLTAPPPA